VAGFDTATVVEVDNGTPVLALDDAELAIAFLLGIEVDIGAFCQLLGSTLFLVGGSLLVDGVGLGRLLTTCDEEFTSGRVCFCTGSPAKAS
jgi:hypothetical protein